jgi:DNA-directed RNA polymerase III subunit RPC8
MALHNEIDLKYPNRVLMDVGLVICRYGDCLKITNGSCVPGDGGSHFECLFRLVVFRPFVEEVCLGKIVKSTPQGIQVSLGGFFQDIHIPAYWMLRPSKYDEKIGLWVWSPDYSGEDGENTVEDGNKDNANIKNEESETKDHEQEPEDDENDDQRYEMEHGAEIRFKVKSIHFTQVTNTAKGVQATTTTTAHSHTFPPTGGGAKGGMEQEEGKTHDRPISLRKRSTSVDLSDVQSRPASMHIVASICEDGLGLTSWWSSREDEAE